MLAANEITAYHVFIAHGNNRAARFNSRFYRQPLTTLRTKFSASWRFYFAFKTSRHINFLSNQKSI
jgi:hypothetical protein